MASASASLVIDMALTTAQLQEMKDALQTALYRGVRKVTFQDRSTEYASVDEMRRALSDLDAQIAASSTTTPSRRSYAAFSKG